MQLIHKLSVFTLVTIQNYSSQQHYVLCTVAEKYVYKGLKNTKEFP